MIQSPMWNAAQGTFNPGYLNYLQGVMAIEFPDAPIEIIHIQTKIMRWKRNCKDHPQARLARGVQFPQFNNWCHCFVHRRNP
ncbi:hypothetical protein RHSIM_Rhsim02G0174400 [Rhododendron simsii]|uniref:Uncharacterized protein n=1 Tax=Rhododendron simsii TaxID=118357 RepID=A0A834HAZ7_RHOSS|nr:hypothetical protein RHSIM_Rhsim02G0174400 [Rhododendron simsii]